MFQYSLLLLAILFYPSKSLGSSLTPARDHDRKLENLIASCVVHVAETHIQHRETISVLTDDFTEVLSSLISKLNWSMYTEKYTNKTSKSFEEALKVQNYVIAFETLEDLRSKLAFLNKSPVWNPHAKFIITSSRCSDSVEEIVEVMWTYRVLNAVIMVPSSMSNVLDIYSWYPYINGNCADDFTSTTVINICRDGSLVDATVDLFPNKIPHNLNGCPVRARPIGVQPYVILPANIDRTQSNLNISEGLEIMLLNTVASAANFKLNYTLSRTEFDYGQILENNSKVVSSGLMAALINREVDIGFGCVGSTPIRYKYLDSTVPYIFDPLVWCVPHAKLLPKWKCLFNIFHPSTWSLSFLTMFLMTICLWARSYNTPHESKSYRALPNCSTNMLAVFLGVSVHIQPRAGINRCFFMIWIVFSLHLTISYQTGLVSVLTSPSYAKQITSMEEIFHRDELTFGSVPNGMRYFDNQQDWRMRRVYEEGVTCSDPATCMQKVASERNYAFAFTRKFIQFVEGRFVTADGEPSLYIFKDRVVLLVVFMSMSRGYPLTQRINNLVTRITEAGFLQFWFSELKEKPGIWATGVSGNQMKLNMYNLQGAFYLLALGMLLASAVFVVEVVLNRHKSDRFKLG